MEAVFVWWKSGFAARGLSVFESVVLPSYCDLGPIA